jgi:hypothetical protein
LIILKALLIKALLIHADKKTVPNKTWNSSTQWVKGNIGQNGFYRVNYPVDNWKLLAEQLQYNHSVCQPQPMKSIYIERFTLKRLSGFRFI